MPKTRRLATLLIQGASSLNPLLLLAARLWMAHIFWNSGIVKISDWDSTLYLFAHEYSVPLLPPMIAAVIAALFELSCPVLLTLGLATRLATLPLLVMTAVINFTYQPLDEHYYWAFLLGFLLVFGGGTLSLDEVIVRKWGSSEAKLDQR